MKITRPVLLASAALVALTALTGCNHPVATRQHEASATETITPATDSPSPTPTPSPSLSMPADGVFKFKDTVVYSAGIEVGLSDFKRGVTSEYASPSYAPYLKFTVKVYNGSVAPMDLSALMITCSYGANATTGEEIYDSERGLNGGSSSHLLQGKTARVTLACALPKNETSVQIEVTPDWDSNAAIFAGSVAR